MRRRITSIMSGNSNSGYNYFAFIICAALFLCGCVAGAFSTGYIDDTGAAFEFMSGYLQLTSEGISNEPSFWGVLLNMFKFHIAALLLGTSLVGVLGVPLLSAVRGFLLTFSAAVICKMFGAPGLPLALAMYGIGAAVSLPCYFILAGQAFSSSGYFLQAAVRPAQRSSSSPYTALYFMRIVICFTVLLLAALLETYLAPHIIRLAYAGI